LGCNKCPQSKEYPASLFLDRSKNNYKIKKEYFTSVQNMTVVSVSNWLNEQVKQSFFNKYPSCVIYNGVDTNTFAPRKNIFKISERYNLRDEYIILGVAGIWSFKKGLNDFLKLSEKLNKGSRIILVGLNQSQLKDLPENIIGLPLLTNRLELSYYYSVAHVFLNLSVEETFGLTTVEALSCGTPAIVYNSTACPEIIDSETGIVVERNNIEDLVAAIEKVREKGKTNYSSACRARVEKMFDEKDRFQDYVQLINELI
jgi:glycosyltransferase involved in cell wall biosynthesis